MGESLVVHPTLWVNHTLPQNNLKEVQEEKRLLNNIKQVAGVLAGIEHAVSSVMAQPSRTACCLVTGISAVESLWQLNLPQFVVMATAVVCELRHIFGKNNNQLQYLLGEATAGIEMMRTLQDKNIQSCSFVEDNLYQIQTNVQELTKRLTDIDQLATSGRQDIEEKKEMAAQSFADAKALFAESELSFKKAYEQKQESSKIFEETLCDFENLLALSSNPKELEKDPAKLAILAKEMQEKCLAAQYLLQESSACLEQGLSMFQEANLQQEKACTAWMQASDLAIQTFKEIQYKAEIAELKKDCEDRIEKSIKEVVSIKDREREMQVLALQVQGDIKDALHLADQQISLFDVAFGGTMGALFTGGCNPIGMAAGIVVGTKAFQYRSYIGGKIDSWLFGPQQAAFSPPQPYEINYKFNVRSTGFWGDYVEKRESKTKGMVQVNLGKDQFGRQEILKLEFNFNQKELLSKVDVLKLVEKLLQKVEKGAIPPEKCLHLIQSLENQVIMRGNKPCVGFIKRNSPFFGELKRICHSLIAAKGKNLPH
jgi:predicted RecB family endonuclease